MGSKMDSRPIRALTYSDGKLVSLNETLIEEVPLEIIINGSQRILIMHTPVMSYELVHGFLYTDGYVSDVKEITRCEISSNKYPDGGIFIEAAVTTTRVNAKSQLPASDRISYSSCGICGREELEEMTRGLGRIKSRQHFSMEVLRKMLARMKDYQPLYKNTKAAHAALLFDAQGKFIGGTEDVGRHNAIDKAIGRCLLEGISTHDKAIVSSGRASLEMILKAVKGGFPLFVAMSRPTTRAVEAAKFYNLTLIDLAKDTNRIYSHARRLREYQG